MLHPNNDYKHGGYNRNAIAQTSNPRLNNTTDPSRVEKINQNTMNHQQNTIKNNNNNVNLSSQQPTNNGINNITNINTLNRGLNKLPDYVYKNDSQQPFNRGVFTTKMQNYKQRSLQNPYTIQICQQWRVGDYTNITDIDYWDQVCSIIYSQDQSQLNRPIGYTSPVILPSYQDIGDDGIYYL